MVFIDSTPSPNWPTTALRCHIENLSQGFNADPARFLSPSKYVLVLPNEFDYWSDAAVRLSDLRGL